MAPSIILSTGSLYNLDVSTIMTLAAEVGFSGIELVVDWRWETHRLAHLERLMARTGLPILAIHSPFLKMPLHGWPDHPVQRIQQSVQLAEVLGAKIVVVHPPERWLRLQVALTGPTKSKRLSLPLSLAGWGELGRWLWHDLAEFQSRTPVKITVENMPCRPFGPFSLKPHHFSSPADLNHFFYLTLDTTHLGTCHVDLLNFYEAIKPKLAHVHLSNYNGREHQLLADGHLPLASFLRRLATDGYDGLISLELNTHDLHAEDETALKSNLRDNLRFCQQAYAAYRAE